MGASSTLSIIIPAKNEAASLKTLLPAVKASQPDAEVILVNDGSTDETSKICEDLNVIEVRHAYSKGNGAAIKAGARRASGDVLVFMDGDGQHRPEDIARLLAVLNQDYDMVIGARQGLKSQANIFRGGANYFYNRLATYMVGHSVEDLTSGFRVVSAKKFKEFLHLLPNGFSYPTTSTMAFFRAGYSVAYEPIEADKRIGKSHVNLLRDGIRFLLIIFKIGTLYSPLKLFFPTSLVVFMVGFSYYMYTFFTEDRFTNMSALLFTTSLLVF